MTPVSFIYRKPIDSRVINNGMKFFEANEIQSDPSSEIDYDSGKITKWKYMPVNRWIWELVQAKKLLGVQDSEAGKFEVSETSTPNVWLVKPLSPGNRERIVAYGDEAHQDNADARKIARDIVLDEFKQQNLGPFDVMPSLSLKVGADRKKLKQDFPDVTIESLASGLPGWREAATEKLDIEPTEQWRYFPHAKVENLMIPTPRWFSEDKRKRFPKIETLSFTVPSRGK